MRPQIGVDHFLQSSDGTIIARGGYVQAAHLERQTTCRVRVTDILDEPGVLWIVDEAGASPR
ncbi:hypothetical protein [Kocuria sabuli]|uniref:hypothetical protein n=1 Tax=Kocuria sabuli TaxID=3071448 RepID=UPI0034D68A5C